MKSPRIRLWSVAPLLALCCIGYAQGAEVRPAETKAKSPLIPQGLRRLAGMPSEHGGGRIPAQAISIVELDSPQVAGSTGRVAAQGKIPYLALAPETEWSVPLRPLRAGANYVTFTMHASVDSVVSVDGALVSLVKSERPGYATVMVGYPKDNAIEWMSLMHDVELRPYSGQLMGTLAIVTICTDTESGRWSLTTVDRLAAYDLPLGSIDPTAPRKLSVRTGPAGAWVCGVASSDENPVFEDVNHNGVRDSFEMKMLGAILDHKASREARERLIHLWKERSYIQPTDYSLTTSNGAGGPEWENVPVIYHTEIPGPDPTPEAAVRILRDIPTAKILNPNPSSK